jgi:hypothetical protein
LLSEAQNKIEEVAFVAGCLVCELKKKKKKKGSAGLMACVATLVLLWSWVVGARRDGLILGDALTFLRFHEVLVCSMKA